MDLSYLEIAHSIFENSIPHSVIVLWLFPEAHIPEFTGLTFANCEVNTFT
jgi:hypothetical protein